MRLEIAIGNKLRRTDPGTVDHEIELPVYLVEPIEDKISGERSARFEQSFFEIIKIPRRIHDRNRERETTGEGRGILRRGRN